MPYNRIIIVGPPGSGKSYAAEKLSHKFQIPWFDLNEDGTDSDPFAQNKLMADVLSRSSWICEQVTPGPWRTIYQRADHIYLLIPSLWLRDTRILFRHWQKMRGISFRGHPPPTLRLLLRMLAINHRYHQRIFPALQTEIIQSHRPTTVIFDNMDLLKHFSLARDKFSVLYRSR